MIFKLRFGVTRKPASGLVHLMLGPETALCRRTVVEILALEEESLRRRPICKACVNRFDDLRFGKEPPRR